MSSEQDRLEAARTAIESTPDSATKEEMLASLQDAGVSLEQAAFSSAMALVQEHHPNFDPQPYGKTLLHSLGNALALIGPLMVKIPLGDSGANMRRMDAAALLIGTDGSERVTLFTPDDVLATRLSRDDSLVEAPKIAFRSLTEGA